MSNANEVTLEGTFLNQRTYNNVSIRIRNILSIKTQVKKEMV